LRTAGLETGYVFEFVNTVHATGSPSAVMKASTIPGILAMVHNDELELHMDITTNVINATLAWHTMIQEASGVGPLRDGIDGTGVTVVVVDSGVDAGHTDLDYKVKTIKNLKSNTDMVWYEVENGDTTSGHGTHCAGTVAGNGDGSGGARAGVAPGANLIGLSTGEAIVILNALGGLEWTYENSRPGNNPYNIRVCTNSWGSSADYDRESPINEAIRKITYENNVVVTFSAGNAGSENHDGSEVTTNPYSQEPAAISIAAATHDGKGMATFSSRGIASDDFSWPDVNAPGVAIWSTRARRTFIDRQTKDQGDAHYMAISGTSMSNPHVAGLVALLWQACPSMRVSNISGDNSHGDENYLSDPFTKMHEAELILKLTATFVNSSGQNGVPIGNWTGLLGKPKDFAQGYGLVDAHKAVGLAVALHELRRANPDTTVLEAYALFSDENIFSNYSTTVVRTAKTNAMETSWNGDWTQLSNAAGGMLLSEQKRMVYVPPEAVKITAEIQYQEMNVEQGITVGQLTLTCDQGGSTNGIMEIDAAGKSGWWTFDVEGTGFQLSRPNLMDPRDLYKEARISYAVSLRMTLGQGNGTIVLNVTDYHAKVSQWRFAEPDGQNNMTIGLETQIYDLGALYVQPPPPPPPVVVEESLWWLYLIIIIAVLGALSYYAWKKGMIKNPKKKQPSKAIPASEVQEVQNP
ncbi:MAG: S8 family serine peptidase, partial [Candidatus Thermoplasmatota archaeon]|nr:S8 family serine peptidase [Candidatus Thermoplasmatota archaeon]